MANIINGLLPLIEVHAMNSPQQRPDGASQLTQALLAQPALLAALLEARFCQATPAKQEPVQAAPLAAPTRPWSLGAPGLVSGPAPSLLGRLTAEAATHLAMSGGLGALLATCKHGNIHKR